MKFAAVLWLGATAAMGQTGPGGVGATDGASSLELWLKADDGTGQTVDGSAVSTWSDKSGYGYDISQATGSKQPLYKTGILNGQPVVRFDGTDDFYEVSTSALSGATAATGIAVVTGTETAGGDYRTGGIWTFGSFSTNFTHWSGSGTMNGDVLDNFCSSTARPVVTQNALNNQTYIYSISHTGTNLVTHLNGTSQSTMAGGSFGVRNPPLIARTTDSGGSGRYFEGDIAEIAIFDVVLNAAQRVLIENYLSAKYDVAISNDKYAGDGSGYDFGVAGIGKEADGASSLAEAGGLTLANAAFLNDADDYLFFGHNGTIHGWTGSDVTGTSSGQRWERVWYIDKTDAGSNGGNVTLSFDFGDAGLGTPAGVATDYELLFRAGTSGDFSAVTVAGRNISGDRVEFTVDASNLTDGYYSLGNSNTAPVAGFGYALDFDGTDDHVNVGSGISLANQSFSFGAWARRAGTEYNLILSQGTATNNQGLQISFRNAAAGNKFMFAFYNDDLDTPLGYTDADWHFWTGTYDASTNERKIYRDGQLVASDVASADYQGSGALYIGQRSLGDNQWQGRLDEVSVWNRVLSAGEVQEIMHRRLSSSENGLLGYWPFDEGTGSSTADKSANANNGTLTNMDGADWIAVRDGGTFGQALDFDGIEDYVTVGNAASLDAYATSDEITYEYWIYPRSSAAGQDFLAKRDGANVGGFTVETSSGNLVNHYLYLTSPSGSNNGNWPYLQTSFEPNAWNHFALTYKDGDGLRLYKNGSLVGWMGVTGDLNATTGSFTIGSNSNAASFTDGLIDEVRLWSVARTQAEVQQSMNLSLNGNESGLIGYWDFDDGSGTTAADGTSNNNDGTLTNMDDADWTSPLGPVGIAAHKNVAYSGFLGAADADGDGLTYSILSNGSKGTAAVTNASTGAFTYTPNAGQTTAGKVRRLREIETDEGAQVEVEAVVDGQQVRVGLHLGGLGKLTGYGLRLRYDAGSLSFVGLADSSGRVLGGPELSLLLTRDDEAGWLDLAEHLRGKLEGAELLEGQQVQLLFALRKRPQSSEIRVEEGYIGRNRRVMRLIGSLGSARVVPQAYALYPSYPNPFNPSTTIPLALPASGEGVLEIYNVLGQVVRVWDLSGWSSGFHSVVWDGRDGAGRSVGSGAYLVRLRAGDFRQTRKMLLLR